MLPVSQYEALLAEVRGLRRKAQHVQQLANPLISGPPLAFYPIQQNGQVKRTTANFTMESAFANRHGTPSTTNYEGANSDDTTCSEEDEAAALYPTTDLPTPNKPLIDSYSNFDNSPRLTPNHLQEVTSVMSFNSSSGGIPLDRVLNNSPNRSRRSSQQLEAKVDMVYSLLAMLGGQEHADMGETLLALSTNPESCLAMRQSGCIPLLVQLVQSDKEAETRIKAAQALHNLVHAQQDEKIKKREIRVLKLIETTRSYADALRNNSDFILDESSSNGSDNGDDDKHPVQVVAHLMKLSFDEGHRQAICQLGGIYTIANLVEIEHVTHGCASNDAHCILMRRYACMALTNLTFGDSGNKALLCSFREFMRALVVQLQSPSDELRQVTASVLRNLSWRADATSKDILREVGSVSGLMKSAMLDDNKENTLKSILSALWNLSAHCTENKSEICSIKGALGFLVDMLNYKSQTKSLAIVENSGGILRNISSQIAVRDDYRDILREHNCLQVLLEQLKSPSLTIVSNACGTLWNLSAKCAHDQEILWELGAPTMLRSLNHSKHKMIAMGSSAALKNLLSAKPAQNVLPHMDSTALALDLPVLPTLGARKQKALMQDLDQTLSETYDNIEKDAHSLHSSSSTSSNYLSRPKLKQSGKIDDASKKIVMAGDGSICQPSTSYDIKNDDDDAKIVRRSKIRLKEKTTRHADEKDRCSVEDGSDASHSDASVGRSYCSLEILETSPKNRLDNDVDDEEESSEKRDAEKENEAVGAVKSRSSSASRLPQLSRSQYKSQKSPPKIAHDEPIGNEIVSIQSVENPNKIPVGDGGSKQGMVSGLPRRSLNSAIRSRDNFKRERSSEAEKVQNNDASVNRGNGDCERLVTTEPPSDDLLIDRDLEMPQTDKENHPIVSLQSKTIEMSISIDDRLPTIEKSTIDESNDNASSASTVSISPTYSEIGPVNYESRLERSCDEINRVDNRMLDPDAMIESLDRFTAELVSQSSHLQNIKDKTSIIINNTEDNNTWNEDVSSNEVTFPSISGSAPNVITFEKSDSLEETNKKSISTQIEEDVTDGLIMIDQKSNDFSSIEYTSSTMTESTLIAIEAAKMATAFKKEAEMSQSATSIVDLDNVQPPSMINSLLSNSGLGLRSPKLTARKKSTMIRRALTNSSNHHSSAESLSNLDQINPPSILGEALDMEGSMTSVASLPHDSGRTDFVIDGTLICQNQNCNQNGYFSSSNLNSVVSDLENVNPPSIFNEITDLCGSLVIADEDGATIGSEIFEDCYTHTLRTENDVTEFSDANSSTPTQSDLCSSSPENATPKKKNVKQMTTSKQRRNLARDRYKTYVVAAELLAMNVEQIDVDSTSDDFRTTMEEITDDDKTLPSRVTPKMRRQSDRSRFETQILDTTILIPAINSNDSGSYNSNNSDADVSSNRTKSNIRRSFVQRRLENKDRFKTQVLDESSLIPLPSPPAASSPPSTDFHVLLQKEANLVLKSIRETKSTVSNGEELLDCETLSLISNDDEDSEQPNSGGSVNYRTYHKSWGLDRRDIPVIQTAKEPPKVQSSTISTSSPPKPKIVKPINVVDIDEEEVPRDDPIEEAPPPNKAIRGRRKPLYCKPSTNNRMLKKPIKSSVTSSNLVKNVTTSMKSSTKPPPHQQSSPRALNTATPKVSPAKTKTQTKTAPKVVLERQGTFTKSDAAAPPNKSRIPTKNPTRIPTVKPSTSRIPSAVTGGNKSNNRNPTKIYGRSVSADSKDSGRFKSSSSSQSLKAEQKKSVAASQRSSSNSSLNSNSGGGGAARKQVTSKIASIWKKIEASKKQQVPKKDTRVWIQPNSDDQEAGVVLRRKEKDAGDPTKRVSRLGSFIIMDETESGAKVQQIVNAVD